MNNEQQANKFLQWINENYTGQKQKLQAFCNDKKYKFDDDIFSDTYLKIYEKILKDGIIDDSEKGMEAYLFMAFKQNLHRDKLYARNQKRDDNIQNIAALNEMYQNSKLTQEEKLKSDLFKDFSTLYLMHRVEDNFDSEHFYLFRLKTFTNLTYKELFEHTGLKGARQKVVAVKNWLKENVSKEEIDRAFNLMYGDIL
jgi:hypothetical protein